MINPVSTSGGEENWSQEATVEPIVKDVDRKVQGVSRLRLIGYPILTIAVCGFVGFYASGMKGAVGGVIAGIQLSRLIVTELYYHQSRSEFR